MSTIEHVVMGRVHRIHAMRRYVNRTTLKMYGVIVMAVALVSTVSVTNVFQNMASLSIFDAFGYVVNAMTTTEVFVQALLIGIAVVSVLALYDIRKNLRDHHKVFFSQV